MRTDRRDNKLSHVGKDLLENAWYVKAKNEANLEL